MYQVVGLRRVNYTNKAGRLVDGWELHLVELSDYSSVDEGVGVCSVYASTNLIHGELGTGVVVELCYQLSRGTPKLSAVNVKS